MSNEFRIKNGFLSEGNSEVTGSLNVTAGITGSLLGTASYATQALSTSWGSIAGTLSNQTDLSSSLATKQATLVSGTTIKTVNSQSILGSGNLSVGGTTISKIVSSSINQYQAAAGATTTLMFAAQLTGSDVGQTIDLDVLVYNPTPSLSNNPRLRIYLNSTPSLSGAAQFESMNNFAQYEYAIQRFSRRFFLLKDEFNQYTFYGATGFPSDYSAGNYLVSIPASIFTGFTKNYLIITLDQSAVLLAATVKF
jgi:hypothetical protein